MIAHRLICRFAVAVAALWMVSPAVFAAPRALELDDIHRMDSLTEPRLSPDAKVVLYSVTRDNQDSDFQSSDLWTVAWSGGKPRRLTDTPLRNEHHALWSPDGRQIAFLAKAGKDEIDQIHIMAAAGGRARVISKLPAGVGDFVWAPDGKQIALVAEDPLPKAGKDKRGKQRPRPPIEIERFSFKEDGRGYLEGQRQRLYVLDVANGKHTLLTPGDFDNNLPAWSPDGRLIAFVSKRLGDTDRAINNDVYVMEPVAGREPRRVSTFVGNDSDPYWESRPDWSPDSQRLVWLTGGEDKWLEYAPAQLSVADLRTGIVTTPARIDRHFYKPRWSGDGTHIYALIEQDRVTWLARIDSLSGAISYLNSGNRFAYDFDVAADDRVALLDSSDTEPFAVFAVAGDGSRRALARHNEWLDAVQLREAEDLSFKAPDGTEIHAMLMRPANFTPGQPVAGIVRVHGGPIYQFSHEFMFDWQLYTARGYAVLAVNPRGSSGRGFDFSRAIYADWGNLDVGDVLAGVDHAVSIGVVDGSRVGVGGWSYGGILSNALIARDQRFKAAVSGAGSASALGLYGTDQYGAGVELELGTPWQNFDVFVRNSYPLLHADRIHTPTLFQCAEKDFNVPCIGSEQMYQALRSLNVPARLVIYPGQNHSLAVPSYLRHRLQQSLAWYDRYLMP